MSDKPSGPSMRLNTLSPTPAKRGRRIGRGIGSGFGKTAGRGHKGQRSRAGARRDSRFEGGQMPLNRRVPKRGFNSKLARETMEIRLGVLERLGVDEVSMSVLREAGIVPHHIKRAKIFASGEIKRAVTVVGLPATKGAVAAIEKAGGKVVAAAADGKQPDAPTP